LEEIRGKSITALERIIVDVIFFILLWKRNWRFLDLCKKGMTLKD